MELEDPYEARLFQMFKSCDTKNCGFLDENALRQLCSLLELQDKGKVVIEDLLSSDTRINYEQFKEALLNFLGGGSELSGSRTNTTTTTLQYHSIGLSENSNANEDSTQENSQRSLVISDDLPKSYIESPTESSDREVSPKLIVGTKKYGRRSRPQLNFNDENSQSDSETNDISTKETKSNSKTVERSSSQTDIQCNRRRRTLEQGSSRLKRCASLPAQRNPQLQSQTLGHGSKSKTLTKHKSTKINVQKPTSLANDDDVAHKTLSSSVESLGHETLSTTIRDVWSNYSAEVGSSYLTCTQLRIVCERLGLQTTLAERVAVESFDKLHSCQYNQLISVNDFIKLLTGIPTAEDQSVNITHDVFGFDEMTVKETSAHMEVLSAQSIIDIWERSGISNGKNILRALGFDDNEVRLVHLHKVIEEEVRSLEEEQQTTLLRASLALKTAELTSVRQVLRQVNDENVKLRSDNKEANRRVTVLAMEIDERHAILEENAKKEVQSLEQRHNNVVRELTARMASDREHWNSLITKLESRIKTFEQDEIRLKTEIELVRKENEELECEQQNLQKQITEVLEKNIKLNREITDLTESAQCNESLERCYKSGDSVSVQVSNEDDVLQLVEKLGTLQLENHKLRDKNDELVVEVENLNLELQRYKAESKKRASLVLTTTTTTTSVKSESEASLEDVDSGSVSLATKRRGDSPSKTHITEESPRTGKLRKCGNEADSASDGGGQSEEWMALNTELQQHIDTEETKDSIPDVVSILRRRVDELEGLLKLQNSCDETKKNLTSDQCEHTSIAERCKELETSLEQMQIAYEDCEDYWQTKLEEERQLFEKQRQIYEDDQLESDKKFTELMEKVREYEEQFNKDGRLSPIEEKDVLEQQYLDLEAELKEEREKSQKELDNKTKEVEIMHQEIKVLRSEIQNLYTRLGDIVTDACDFSSKAAAAVVHQSDSHGSSASSPISYLWHQSTIQQPAKLLEQPSITSETNDPSTTTTTETNGTRSLQNKQVKSINLSTTELSTFSTPLTSTSSPSQQSYISPIQKPTSKSSQSETDENGAAGDCDTTSTTSGKSLGTQSLVSTQSEIQTTTQNENVKATVEEKQCITPTSVLDDIKRLKFLENSLKDQIKDLSFQRDGLVMELQQLQEARPVLEKAYARTAHPNLTQRISQLELKNRHLQNVIKQQQQYSESMMQQSWRQYQTEMNDLHGRLDAQVAMITEQGQRLQNADLLVKDLYVENAHLTATVQRLEQQRFRVTMMHQQQQQHMNQLQGLNIIPGMP